MLGQQRRCGQVPLLHFRCINRLIQIADSSRLSSQVASSLENITHFLTHRFLASSGMSYANICYLVPDNQAGETTCFTSTVSDNPRSETLMLSFAAGSRRDFISALVRQGTLISEDFGPIKYIVENPEQEALVEMKSGKWVMYAARTLVVRFWDLTKVSRVFLVILEREFTTSIYQKADNLDILLVLAGYVLMHTTFIRLFLSSRSLGSNFWLTTAILSSSTLSFMVALPIAGYLRIPLDPVSLIEALPFLVCTVGFEKPLRLARTVFSHPHLVQPAIQEGRLRGQMKPARDLIVEALDKVGNIIVRDYVLEIAVLLIGAYSKVGGLKEFCALAALLLTVDCAATATFYVAILSVMIEVGLPLVTCEGVSGPCSLVLSQHSHAPIVVGTPHQDVPRLVIKKVIHVRCQAPHDCERSASDAKVHFAPANLGYIVGCQGLSAQVTNQGERRKGGESCRSFEVVVGKWVPLLSITILTHPFRSSHFFHFIC
jgi:Sterol-sensing domain of SREBP cleavage-activation